LPSPVPVAPLVTVTQAGERLDAVHVHPASAVTVICPLPPALLSCTLSVLSTAEQPLAVPACITVADCPRTTTVALLVTLLVLRGAEKRTVPLPVPICTAVNHSALLVDVHSQSAGAATAISPSPPSTGIPVISGLSTGLQVEPLWAKVKYRESPLVWTPIDAVRPLSL
jgi:hypothetical protein